MSWRRGSACSRQPAFAESLGLKVSESRQSAPGDYTDMLELSAAGEGKSLAEISPVALRLPC